MHDSRFHASGGAAPEPKTRKKPGQKVKFTLSEDNLLQKLVEKMGDTNWVEIAAMIPGRNPRQCHDRWFYYLSPNVKKTPWTEEEELLLCKCVREIGPHWVRISRMFEGRTDTQIKNKWNVLKRRIDFDHVYTEKKEKTQTRKSKANSHTAEHKSTLAIKSNSSSDSPGDTHSPSTPGSVETSDSIEIISQVPLSHRVDTLLNPRKLLPPVPPIENIPNTYNCLSIANLMASINQGLVSRQ